MRILHYLRFMRFDQGGPVRAIADLSEALARAGHRLTVVTQDARDAPADWREPGANPAVVELKAAQLPGELFGPRQVARIRGLVAAQDVVHVHQLWLPTTAQVVAAARSCRKPYIVSLRGMLDDWCMRQRERFKRTHLGLIGRRILEGAAVIHCTAEGELRQAGRWFPKGHAEVIPNFLDVEPYRHPPPGEVAVNRFGLRSDVPRLLFLSRLHPKKNVEALLGAAAELASSGRPHEVVIAGSGEASYERRLRQMVAELELSEWIRFLGFVQGENKLSLYRASDAFVLPTHQENFGFVLFESMLCQTPVVTTFSVDTWPELEASGGASITTIRNLSNAIGALTRDRDKLVQMGRAGAEWAAGYLDRSRVTALFEDCYRGALHSGPRERRRHVVPR